MNTIRSPSERDFLVLLRIARSSAAHPPGFAAPVAADEDDESLTVIFHAPERRPGRVHVEATEQELRIWERKAGGRRGAMRVCALPSPIVATGIETARSGELLRVRMPKKRPAMASPETSSSST
jgi:hypothetical protein